MIVIKEAVVLFQISKIPTKIEVVAADIRNTNQRTFMLQHEGMGHGCGTCFVHCVAQVIEQHMVFHQIFGHTMHRHLIAQTPADNGWMIIALGNEFPHLVQRILSAVWHMFCDIGNFRPYHHAVFVAQVVKFLGMLIMCKPNGVGTHFPNNIHILPMFPDRKGIAKPLPILVAADTPKGIHSAIEKEALLRIKGDASASKTGHYLIFSKFRFCGIKIRIFYAIPQMNIVEYKFRLCISIPGRNFCLLTCNPNPYISLANLPGFYGDDSIFSRYNRRNMHSGRSVFTQCKVSLRNNQQVHISVQTTI